MGNAIREERNRKNRSDKKHSMRPTISVQLNENLSRLSYITDTPIKDVAETLCKLSLITTTVIESFVPHFQRDYWSTACVMYPGHYDNAKYPVKREAGRVRTSIRFQQRDYIQIERLAFSLSITPHATASLLLEKALRSASIVNAYVSNHVRKSLDPARMRELREVYKFINQDEDKLSFAALISAIIESTKNAGKNAGSQLVNKINDWLEEED